MEITPPEQDYTKEKINHQKNRNDIRIIEAEQEAGTVLSSETECCQTLREKSKASTGKDRSSNRTEDKKEGERKENGDKEKQVGEGLVQCNGFEKDFLPTTSQKHQLTPPAKMNHKPCLVSRKRQRGSVTSVFTKKARRKLKRND